jgi:uncharacterized paraquat-inducible protein A
MSRCPICKSVRIVIVLSDARRAFCTRCGTRWVQDGAEQRGIQLLAGVRKRSPPATPNAFGG